MSKTPPSIAAMSTLAMVRAAEARSIETSDVLREAGVARDLLEDPDTRLPGSTVLAVWDRLRERCQDPALQLEAPAMLPFGAYRVIDYLVTSSATVGGGVERFARFFGLIAHGVALEVDRHGGAYRLGLAGAGGRPVPPVYVDYTFAALIRRVRMRSRPGLAVQRVELRAPEPVRIEPYQELYRAPIHFGAPADRLWFDPKEWDAPMDRSDEALVAVLEEHARILARHVPRPDAGFLGEVEKAIAARLPEGGSAAEVARALHVSVRTLQRKLGEAGTSFRAVSESVRSQLALSYLADPRVSIAEVAFLLGFSDPSSFNRAFRRWAGESPGAWRRRRTG